MNLDVLFNLDNALRWFLQKRWLVGNFFNWLKGVVLYIYGSKWDFVCFKCFYKEKNWKLDQDGYGVNWTNMGL